MPLPSARAVVAEDDTPHRALAIGPERCVVLRNGQKELGLHSLRRQTGAGCRDAASFVDD